MKKIMLLFLFTVVMYLGATAQVMPAIGKIKLYSEADYKKADSVALQVADYLFQIPLVKDDENRLKAVSFLMKWMEGTPTYTFNLANRAMTYFEGDLDMGGVYMAALTRYTIHNPDANSDKVSLNAVMQVLDYADDAHNKVVLSKSITKLMKAYKKGELEKIL